MKKINGIYLYIAQDVLKKHLRRGKNESDIRTGAI
jgi:hypothetical protein